MLFCASKRRNSTEPRDRWGLWSLAGKGSVCPIPCHLTPWPGHRTTTRFKRQPAAPIHAHHSIAKDSDHNAGNGERQRHAGNCREFECRFFEYCLVSTRRHEGRTENLHGAHLAYTRRRTREPKAGCLPREGVFRNQRPRFGKEGFL